MSSGSQDVAGTEFAQLRSVLCRPGRGTLGGFPGGTLLGGDARLTIHVACVIAADRPRTVTGDATHPA